MSAGPNLSLILGDGRIVPMGDLAARRLPLLRSVPQVPSAVVAGRKRSYVTLPGYRKGEKPGNYGRTFPAEVLTTGEMLRLFAAAGDGMAAERNRALWTVLWRTGLRIAEALSLCPKDVDLARRELVVLRGKGGKRRPVGFDEQTARVLEQWLARRADLGVTASQPVFCVVTRPTVGKRMHDSCAREALRDAARRAGIDKRVHPHGLRHTFAFELANEKVPLHVIRVLLGHSNLATTARYVDHLAPAEALEFARARSWEAA